MPARRSRSSRSTTRRRGCKAEQKVARKSVVAGPALPGKLADCSSQDPKRAELFLVEGDSAGGSAKQARDREFQAVMPLRGKILNTWEVERGRGARRRRKCTTSPSRSASIPAPTTIDGPALRQGLHPRRRRLRRPAHRDAAVRAVPAALPAAGARGARLRRDAAAVPHRRRQAGLATRSTTPSATASSSASQRRSTAPSRQVHALQGPGRDEPAAAARDDDGAARRAGWCS